MSSSILLCTVAAALTVTIAEARTPAQCKTVSKPGNVQAPDMVVQSWVQFIAVLTLLLLIITYIPWLALVVPDLYYGAGSQ